MMKEERRNTMPTVHNEAKLGDIAKVVLMPGDPLRAKYIAETYLDDVYQFNAVRNMFGYTGYYKNHRVSVMASGMGIPSMAIYSYELFTEYDVDVIVRIGSAGAYDPELNLFDLVLVESSYSESNYAYSYNQIQNHIQYPNPTINDILYETAQKQKKPILLSRVHTSDTFYHEEKAFPDQCACVEMESYALFFNANILHKKAACLLTISDSLVSSEKTTSKQRETALNSMIELALESVEKLYEI